jgi:hypothetical protein
LFASHPALQNRTPADLAFTIPLVWHSDAGPFSKTKAMQLVQWGSLVGAGADIEQRFISMVWLAKYGDYEENKG